jgi:hypothetical protein
MGLSARASVALLYWRIGLHTFRSYRASHRLPASIGLLAEPCFTFLQIETHVGIFASLRRLLCVLFPSSHRAGLLYTYWFTCNAIVDRLLLDSICSTVLLPYFILISCSIHLLSSLHSSLLLIALLNTGISLTHCSRLASLIRVLSHCPTLSLFQPVGDLLLHRLLHSPGVHPLRCGRVGRFTRLVGFLLEAGFSFC